MENILPLIEYGHTDFGENKVQEAIENGLKLKKKHKFEFIHDWKTQSNKVNKQLKFLIIFIHLTN